MEETRVTSETGGEKGVKPARFDLLDSSFLWEMAKVCGYGASKYNDDNWRRGYNWRYSLGALQRHLHLFWQGEDIDEESGCHHIAMVGWHAMALYVFSTNSQYSQFDTRIKSSPVLCNPIDINGTVENCTTSLPEVLGNK